MYLLVERHQQLHTDEQNDQHNYIIINFVSLRILRIIIINLIHDMQLYKL